LLMLDLHPFLQNYLHQINSQSLTMHPMDGGIRNSDIHSNVLSFLSYRKFYYSCHTFSLSLRVHPVWLVHWGPAHTFSSWQRNLSARLFLPLSTTQSRIFNDVSYTSKPSVQR